MNLKYKQKGALDEISGLYITPKNAIKHRSKKYKCLDKNMVNYLLYVKVIYENIILDTRPKVSAQDIIILLLKVNYI